MVTLILNLIIALLIAGFVYWIWLKIKPLLAGIIADPFMSIIDVLIVVLIGAIVLFMVIIPLLKTGAALIHI